MKLATPAIPSLGRPIKYETLRELELGGSYFIGDDPAEAARHRSAAFYVSKRTERRYAVRFDVGQSGWRCWRIA